MNQDNKKYLVWLVIPVILSLGLIIAAFTVSKVLVEIKSDNNTITIKGSAKKEIKSDLVVWSGSYYTESVKLSEAYKALKISQQKVKDYLISKGLKTGDLVFSPIETTTNHVILPDGTETSKIEGYRLSQTVEISSEDVDNITDISREATELINQGVIFESNSPEYYYTKIAELKVDMLGEATKDAKARAEQIAQSTGSNIGKLKTAEMGVFQITSLNSTEVSDYGENDTSSIDKQITSIVSCKFEIKD